MTTLMDKINVIFTNKWFNLIAIGIIAGLILIAYSNTFTASFHFDDNPAVIENPNIRHVTMDNIMTILKGKQFLSNLQTIKERVSGVRISGDAEF